MSRFSELLDMLSPGQQVALAAVREALLENSQSLDGHALPTQEAAVTSPAGAAA